MNFSRRHMLALTAGLAVAPVHAGETPLLFAAASLKTVVDDLRANLPDIEFNVAYGGSGGLARQILQGAPADIFLPANKLWMDEIAKAGLLRDTPVDLLGNQLVLAGPKGGAAVTLDDTLRDQGRIAMGYVDAVPSGQYGKAAFQSLGLWDGVAPNIVQTENVRAALALVSRAEVPLAVVYATDVMADENTEIAAVFAPETYPQITYPLAMLSRARVGSDAVFAELTGARAELFYKLHGFEVVI